MEQLPTGTDSLLNSLPGRVAGWAFAVGLGAMFAAAPMSPPIGYGVAVGAGLMVGLLEFYRRLAPVLVDARRPRRSRAVFWIVWIVKWPLLAIVLYLSLRHGWASPLGLGIGIGIVPMVATTFGLRAVVLQGRHEARRAGAGR